MRSKSLGLKLNYTLLLEGAAVASGTAATNDTELVLTCTLAAPVPALLVDSALSFLHPGTLTLGLQGYRPPSAFTVRSSHLAHLQLLLAGPVA